MAEFELALREAEKADAADLICFLNQVGAESDYMTWDVAGILMADEPRAPFRQRPAESDFYERIRHIGQVFIVVKKAFWNQGLGRILLEEAVDWAENGSSLRRLELTVQVRNERAVHLYKELGFEIEGLQKRGAYLREGIFLDVYLMGKLID